MLASPAGAMTFAAPAAIGNAATDTSFVQVQYYHRYYHHHYYNYYGYRRPYGYYGVPFIGFGW
jgi:hypothetical protein